MLGNDRKISNYTTAAAKWNKGAEADAEKQGREKPQFIWGKH
jgi:hypothetical protein